MGPYVLHEGRGRCTKTIHTKLPVKSVYVRQGVIEMAVAEHKKTNVQPRKRDMALYTALNQ